MKRISFPKFAYLSGLILTTVVVGFASNQEIMTVVTDVSNGSGVRIHSATTVGGSLWLVDEDGNGDAANPNFTNYWGFVNGVLKSPSGGRPGGGAVGVPEDGCAVLDACKGSTFTNADVNSLFYCEDVPNMCSSFYPNCRGSNSTAYAKCVTYLNAVVNQVFGWGCGGNNTLNCGS